MKFLTVIFDRYMKNPWHIVLFLLMMVALTIESAVGQDLKFNGYVGDRIDQIISKRILAQDVGMLVAPFELKNETRCWQSEFWGKWMLSAVSTYQYQPSDVLLDKMQGAVQGLLSSQLPNGYIGNYGPEHQLTSWDIWGRKYSMLGLIRYFEVTGDRTALEGATKVADHLISQIGPGKTDITHTGFYRGMASSSVLEPVVYLYNHTGNKDYLDFASYIIAQWESPDGAKLISKGLENVPVKDRFPPPEKWWSWENGQKAYEMMSCYEGLLEYYKVTKNPSHLEAVIKTVDNIMETEINIAGSGSAFECWYGGKNKQTIPTFHTMETCVTITWMKLCNNLLELTGNPKYADEIERSFYNALLASVKNDASEIAKYSPLVGIRSEGEHQCNMPINCCNANGPRGFTLMPDFAVKSREESLTINYLGSFRGEWTLNKKVPVKINQKTDYPVSGRIAIYVDPERKLKFALKIRIPAWAENARVQVNDGSVIEVQSGAYMTIDRTWEEGDLVLVNLNMSLRKHELNEQQALTWGPLALARDSRFQDGDVDESMIIDKKELTAKPVDGMDQNIWMVFTVPGRMGANMEAGSDQYKAIKFCDFGSAGNTWDENDRYRVWLPKTLNVMKQNYESY
jgi:hypothetical protein